MSELKREKIKYLHIMTDTNFAVTATFARMVNTHMDPSEHFFLVDSNEKEAPDYMKAYENVLSVDHMGTSDEGEKTLFDYAGISENIIFHSLGWHWKLQKKLLERKDICSRALWIPWGRDLYEYERRSSNPLRSVYYGYTNKIMTSLRKNMSAAAVIFPKDTEKVSELLGGEKKVYEARYTTFSEEDVLRMKPEKRDSESFNILLGHASMKCLEHEKMLKALSHFKGENVRIYIPLSYGDKLYARSVSSYAGEIFGDKAVVLSEFMDADEYTALLWQMDAAIFNTERQVALGNICRLIYMCCKIYTLPGGALERELSANGCKTFDSGKIAGMTFDDFRSTEDICREPPEWARDSMDIGKTAEIWENIFEKISSR